MTQIDFYILSGDTDRARLELCCRIADKAMQREHHVFINSATEQESRQLDELLWTFSQGSFVPHAVVGGAAAEPPPEPVLIGCDTAPVSDHWDVLINLTSSVPEWFSRYERVVEVVDAQPKRRDEGRERFRFYRDRGYPLNTHQL